MPTESSLEGLGDCLTCHACEDYSSSSEEEDGIPLIQGGTSDYFPNYWFEPSATPWEDLQLRVSDTFLTFNCMNATTTQLLKFDDGDTICEICGGESRATRVLVRYHDKRLTTGPNFDLVADIDLTNSQERAYFWEYRRRRRPKVCVMAPMCRSFGGRSRM